MEKVSPTNDFEQLYFKKQDHHEQYANGNLAEAASQVQRKDKAYLKHKRNSNADLDLGDSPSLEDLEQPDFEHMPRHQYHTNKLTTNHGTKGQASLASRNSQVSQISK